MYNGRNITAVIDGSLEGLMTAVHLFYYEKFLPIEIVDNKDLQLSLGTEYRTINTNFEKAEKVWSAIRKKISKNSQISIYRCYLNQDSKKYLAIFKYIILGFKVGYTVDNYETEDYVLDLHKMSRYVMGEAHLFAGFTRFTKTSKGIYYANISPTSDVLPLVADHFADRLMNEQWIIHDLKRKQAAIYDGSGFIITEVKNIVSFEKSEDEEFYQTLWKEFHASIGVQGRTNKKLQQSLLPKHYRKYMTEFIQT